MLYSCRAVDQKGQASAGERDSGSERELADALRHEGYLLLEVKAKTAIRAGRRLMEILPNPFRRITLVERMTLARNMAVMIGAGLAMTRVLEALKEQSQNWFFREVISDAQSGITKGQTLAESLRPYEKIFGTLFINMVEAGEISGTLEKVLKILARQMQRDHELRSKVKSALFYPAIVIAAMLSIGALMMIWVVPTLTQTFSELGVDLPITTRIIIASSNFLLAYYWYVAAFIVAVIAVLFKLFKTSAGKRVFDSVILRLPIFGALVQKLNSARFARTFSSLLASGVPISKSLEVTSSTLGNIHFRHSILDAVQAIQRGRQLHEILKERPDLFPPMVTAMIQVGEETGTISRMLLRLAIFYEGEVASISKNFSNVIEPILMIVIGGVVGFFAVSMIQPIYGSLGNL